MKVKNLLKTLDLSSLSSICIVDLEGETHIFSICEKTSDGKSITHTYETLPIDKELKNCRIDSIALDTCSYNNRISVTITTGYPKQKKERYDE